MATDRVIGFLHDLVGDPNLNQQLSKVERSPAAWVNVAKESGYEFSVDELKFVSEEIVQKPLTPDNFIPDLVSAMTVESVPKGNGNGNGNGKADSFAFSPQGISRLKSVMQQGRYSGYYRPW